MDNNKLRNKDDLFGSLEKDAELNRTRMKSVPWKIIPKIISDNIGFLLVIVPSIGALIQIKQLVDIDISYLRFFSVSQLVADGVLALVPCVIFILLSYIYQAYISLGLDKELEVIQLNQKLSYIRPLFLLSIVVFASFTYYSEPNKESIYNDSPTFMLIMASVGVGFIFYIINDSKYNKSILKKRNNKHQVRLNIIKILDYTIWLSYILILYTLISTFIIYTNILEVPRDFENYNKVGFIVNQYHEDLNAYEVLYFNDRYTFVKLDKDTGHTIEVYKTDAILFYSTVVKIEE